MKQIITQHGWGLNKYFWDDYKVDFLNNNWHCKIMKGAIFRQIIIKQNGLKANLKKKSE